MTGDRAADKRTAGARAGKGVSPLEWVLQGLMMMILVAVPPVLSLRLFRYRTARNPGDRPDTPDDAPGSGNLSPGAVAAADRSGAGNGSRAVLPDGRQDQPRGVGRNGGQPGGRVRFRQALFGRYAGYLLPVHRAAGYTG